MTTTHDQQFWQAGDDWQINATLLDANGNPYDLTGVGDASVVLKWALMTSSFKRALDEDDVLITVVEPEAGRCSITIPASATAPLVAGRYTDYIRIVSGGVTSTLSYGLIYVAADPWMAAETTMAVMPVRRIYSKPRLVA